jgi:hypothetical protein
MQLVEQLDEILGEHLWRKFVGPEEAPFTFSLQHFGEPVKSAPPLAGVGHNVRYSEPSLQGILLYLQCPAVAFRGAPAPAKDILKASKPDVIDNILGTLSDRRLELCHYLWRGPRLPPVIHVNMLQRAFGLAFRRPPVGSERNQGGNHLHLGFSGELEIGRLAAGNAAEIVADKIGRSSLALTRHDGLDLVAIDIAASLAFERQSYSVARASEIAGGEVRLALKNVLSMVRDALADILEIIALSSRQDTQPIVHTNPHDRRETIPGSAQWQIYE